MALTSNTEDVKDHSITQKTKKTELDPNCFSLRIIYNRPAGVKVERHSRYKAKEKAYYYYIIVITTTINKSGFV